MLFMTLVRKDKRPLMTFKHNAHQKPLTRFIFCFYDYDDDYIVVVVVIQLKNPL